MNELILTHLCTAARSLWDTTATLADADAVNGEYLRGQVETIMRAVDWPEDTDLGSDGPREFIRQTIFQIGA